MWLYNLLTDKGYMYVCYTYLCTNNIHIQNQNDKPLLIQVHTRTRKITHTHTPLDRQSIKMIQCMNCGQSHTERKQITTILIFISHILYFLRVHREKLLL